MTVKFYRAYMRLELPDGRQLEPGQIFTSLELSDDKAEKLAGMEVISEAVAPPLLAVPGWKSRGNKLYKEGVETFGQFFERDDKIIAALFNVKPEVVAGWKNDLLAILEFRR